MAEKLNAKRPCEVCGESQARRKVWAKFYKKVICYTCGVRFAFDKFGNVVKVAAQNNLDKGVQS